MKSMIAFFVASFITFQLWAGPDSGPGLCEQKKGHVAISLSRTACFGTCPIYDVIINADGTVEYNGKSYVSEKGIKKYSIPKDKARDLIAEFKKAKFFNFKSSYTLGVTDMPTYILCFSDGKRVKTIVDYSGRTIGMPEVINTLEGRVDEVAETSQFMMPPKSSIHESPKDAN